MSADSSVLGQFEAALAAADWLCESDLAAVELCRVYARLLAEDPGGKVSYVGGLFLSGLKSLGLTLDSRSALVSDRRVEVRDELAEMRARRA